MAKPIEIIKRGDNVNGCSGCIGDSSNIKDACWNWRDELGVAGKNECKLKYYANKEQITELIQEVLTGIRTRRDKTRWAISVGRFTKENANPRNQWWDMIAEYFTHK